MSKFSELESIIRNNSTFLITTHVNPDADAIGSEIAFTQILRKLGKTFHIINYSETPYYLEYLDSAKIIQKYSAELHNELLNSVDVIVALDLNKLNRTVKMEEIIRNSKAVKICIDHHQEPENFTSNYFNGNDFCATGHIIYNFIRETNIVDFDYTLAVPLYSAIMTDTGSFRFDRTTSEVHNIAAHLIELGVIPIEIHSQIYDQNSIGKLKLLGKALQSLKLYGEKEEVAVLIIRQDDFFQNNTSENDTEGFINLCMSIKSVKIALKFLEVTEGFKVSLRSKGSIPVHNLAAEFNGGGHQNAAGIRIRNKMMDEFIPVVIQKALSYANQAGN
jgi:phosphoesterase RecJ-like protein